MPTFKEEREAAREKENEKMASGSVSISGTPEAIPPSKQDRLDRAKRELEKRELFKEGRLVHRTEPELKTHTSYLVFAVLPREWTKADEEKAAKRWG